MTQENSIDFFFSLLFSHDFILKNSLKSPTDQMNFSNVHGHTHFQLFKVAAKQKQMIKSSRPIKLFGPHGQQCRSVVQI